MEEMETRYAPLYPRVEVACKKTGRVIDKVLLVLGLFALVSLLFCIFGGIFIEGRKKNENKAGAEASNPETTTSTTELAEMRETQENFQKENGEDMLKVDDTVITQLYVVDAQGNQTDVSSAYFNGVNVFQNVGWFTLDSIPSGELMTSYDLGRDRVFLSIMTTGYQTVTNVRGTFSFISNRFTPFDETYAGVELQPIGNGLLFIKRGNGSTLAWTLYNAVTNTYTELTPPASFSTACFLGGRGEGDVLCGENVYELDTGTWFSFPSGYAYMNYLGEGRTLLKLGTTAYLLKMKLLPNDDLYTLTQAGVSGGDASQVILPFGDGYAIVYRQSIGGEIFLYDAILNQQFPTGMTGIVGTGHRIDQYKLLVNLQVDGVIKYYVYTVAGQGVSSFIDMGTPPVQGHIFVIGAGKALFANADRTSWYLYDAGLNTYTEIQMGITLLGYNKKFTNGNGRLVVNTTNPTFGWQIGVF